MENFEFRSRPMYRKSSPLLSNRKYQSFDLALRGGNWIGNARRLLVPFRKDKEEAEEKEEDDGRSSYPTTPSDVEFIVENQHLPGHRGVLSEKSAYFQALLNGGFSETSQKEVTLNNMPLEAFKAVLHYMYTTKMPLTKMATEDIIDSLSLADQFGLNDLKSTISEFLRQHLTIANVCGVFEEARLCVLDNLIRECIAFMDRHAERILQEGTLNRMSSVSLERVLRRDAFFCLREQMTSVIQDWCDHHKQSEVETLLSYLLVPPGGNIDAASADGEADVVFDPITEQEIPCHLLQRATKWVEVNMATGALCSRTIQGESCGALLEDDLATYTWHPIADDSASGGGAAEIVVQLGDICRINHIKLLLLSGDGDDGDGNGKHSPSSSSSSSCSYSYYVEVSANQLHWERVIDYTAYHCRSWQQLYFESRPVRYIRLVGTHNTAGDRFAVSCLKALFTAHIPDTSNGFVERHEDISIIAKGAAAAPTWGDQLGGCKQLVKEEINTNEKFGCGVILVHLGQPYVMRSVRWNCDDETCSFSVEVSSDQLKWDVVADKRWDDVDLEKTIFFQPRPIVFIRIVANSDKFRFVHLSCALRHKELPPTPTEETVVCKQKKKL